MFRRAARWTAACAVVAALTALVVSAGRQDPEAVPSSAEVAARVMSPFCPGLSLDECPSGQAAGLRARIESRIASGATNREIDRWLVADYGESVLARPPQAVAWAAPAGFLLAGFALVFAFLERRGKLTLSGETAKPASGGEDKTPAPAGASRAKMLEDLSQFAESTE